MNENYVYEGSEQDMITIIDDCSACGESHEDELLVLTDEDDETFYVECPSNKEKVFITYY